MSESKTGTVSNTSAGWSGSKMLLAGAASITAIAASYLIYGYTSGWKGPAYNFWCPKRRIKKVESPFFSKISEESEQRDV